MNLKQKLSKKLKKTGGFTLIEMLIVVAIIAILVVVSIPMVNSSLNKAKQATDDANERSAKAAALLQHLADEKTEADTYYFNASTGEAQENTTGITGYNQLTQDSCAPGTGWVKVEITADGTVAATGGVTWSNTAAP